MRLTYPTAAAVLPPPDPRPAASASTDGCQRFAGGGISWVADDDVRPLLFDAAGLRLASWEARGLATLVKHGAGRTIHRVRLPGLEFFVKRFRPASLSSLLHNLFRSGRARKEFESAQWLRRRGVPTFRPLALGERRRGGLLVESWLVTEAVPDSVTLFDAIERGLPGGASSRLELARTLGALAARLHEAGAEHRDLHERNIMVRLDADGRPALTLLDLHDLTLRGRTDWPQTCRDLERLARYFALRASRADRLRFFLAYAAERGWAPGESRRRARELEARSARSRADFWRRRDTRGKSGRALIDYFGRRCRATACADVPPTLVRQWLAAPERPFAERVARWLKRGRATQVAEVNLPELRRNDTFIYKQFYFKGWHESLATLVRPNQATRAWNHGAALQLRELPTPRPLALVERTLFGLPVTSYLVTERVPGGVGLRDYADAALAAAATDAERQRIVRGLTEVAALLLRRLHERRATHCDLKASNILAEPTADPARPRLWLIDLDGVQTWSQVPDCQRTQNLARLHVSFVSAPWLSRSDKLRFLRSYLGQEGFRKRAEWQAWWRRVAAATDWKVRRNQRRGRALH